MKQAEFQQLFASPLRNGVSYPSATRGSGVPMVNMGEAFKYDVIADQECERVPLTDTERQRYLLQEGDLLFVRQSLKYEGAGRCVYVAAGIEPRTWESHLIRVRLDSATVNPRYYYYYFRSALGRQSIEPIIHQVAAAGIRGSDLSRLQVPVPELPVQNAIAALLSTLDDKISVNDRIARTMDDLSNALFEEATILCPRISLADIANPVLGATPDRAVSHYWGGTVPWASAKDVANSSFGVVATTEERITEDAAQTTRAKPVPPGSVVLTARGTVGAVARVINLSSFNQSCYAFIPGHIPQGVLFHLIRTASDRMLSISHGTVFSTVNMKTFSHVVVPSIPDAQLPVLEGKLAPLHRGIEHRLLESMTLRDLRDTLLPELMSGRLRIRDAEKIVEEAV